MCAMAFRASEVLAHVKNKTRGGEQAAISSEEVQALGSQGLDFSLKFVPFFCGTWASDWTCRVSVSPSGSGDNRNQPASWSYCEG